MIFEEIHKGIYFNNIKYDIENCVQESEINFRVSKSTTEELPGTQVWFELSDGELFRIKDNIEKSILKQFNNVTYPYTSINWIYTQDKQNDSVFYHNHSDVRYFFKKDTVRAVWSWVFYVQLPTDSKSKLKFSFKEEGWGSSTLTRKTIDVQEGNILVFNPSYDHKPNLPKESDRPRIVLAGTIYNIEGIKKKNNLI